MADIPVFKTFVPNTFLADVLQRTYPLIPDAFTESVERSAAGFVFADQFFLKNNKPMDPGGVNEAVRVKKGQGLSSHKPFGKTPTPNVENLLTTYTQSHRFLKEAVAFDDLEAVFDRSQSTPGRAYSAVKARYSAAAEKTMEDFESLILGLPNDANDNETVIGIPYFIRLGLNSSGTSVATPVPQQIGRFIYQWANGTNTSNNLYFGLDRNDPQFDKPINNYAASYSGEVDEAFLNTMRQMRRKLQWMSLPGLKGDTSGLGEMPYTVICPQDFGVKIESAAQDYKEDHGGNIASVTKPLLQGIRFIESTTLESQPFRPIYMLNNRLIHGMHAKGAKTMVKVTRPTDAATTTIEWLFHSYNLYCKNPKMAGAVIHQSAA